MILAAGYGTRLQPFTSNFPKTLFPIAGRPLLDIIIEALQKAGCRSIIINTHHLHQKIDEFLAEQKYAIPIQTRYEPKILGTGGAIRNVADFWDGKPFMVVNSDIFTDIDFKAVYEFHLNHGHPATLVLYNCPQHNSVLINAEGFVNGFDNQKHDAKFVSSKILTFTGIQVLDPEILKFISAVGYCSSIDAYKKMISAGRRIKAFISANHYWKDIGSPESYRQAVYDIMAPEAFNRAWKGCQVRKIEPAKLKGDGSDRKWYRLKAGKRSLVMVDHGIKKGPKISEADAFVAIGRHLEAAGLPVPRIYLDDSFSGLVFMEDLGDDSLQGVIQKTKSIEDIARHYQSIIRLLLKLSLFGAKNFSLSWTYQTQTYSQELILEKECRYFVEAFLRCYLGWATRYRDFEMEFIFLAKKTLDFSINGFMHRDFQSRNIMVKNKKYYFIDFQGGRIGPIQYDLASLLLDPYVALPIDLQEQLLNYCIQQLPGVGITDPHKFRTGFGYCTLTRNLQILGAFGYLSKVKGKKYFEKYIPIAVKTLKHTLFEFGGSNFPKLKKIAEKLASETGHI